MNKYGLLKLDVVISAKSNAFRDIIYALPANVDIYALSFQHIDYSVYTPPPPYTTIKFHSNDFLDTPSFTAMPEVKWDGKTLDFSACWDTNYMAGTSYMGISSSNGNPRSGAVLYNSAANPCYHIWKKYKGLIDSYEYCDLCGKKQ